MSEAMCDLEVYRVLAERLVLFHNNSGIEFTDEIDAYCEDMLRSFDDSRYSVVVMGTFSRGKSTFLNALIGKEILYKADKEATGIINYILSSNKISLSVSKENDIIVYPNDEHNEISESEIKRMIQEANTADNDAISSLILEYPIKGFDRDIVFIDTPGLSGFKQNALDITRKAIKEANAVVMLLSYKGLDNTELELLRGTSDFGEIRMDNLILVINRIGEMFEGLSPEEEGKKINRSCEEIRRNLQEHKLYEKYRNVQIFAVDSRDYLHSVDNEAYSGYRYEVSQDELRRRSRFISFRDSLVSFLEKSNRAVEMQKTLERQTDEFIRLTRLFFKEALENEKSIQKKRQERLNNRIERLDRNKKSMMRNLNTMVTEDLQELRENIKDECDNKCIEIQEKYQKSIEEDFKELSSFNKQNYQILTNSITEDIRAYEQVLKKQISDRYDSMIKLLEQRVGEEADKLGEIAAKEGKNTKAKFNMEEIELPDVQIKEIDTTDDIKELKAKISLLESDITEQKITIERLEKELSKLYNDYLIKQQSLDQNYQNTISWLPSRPTPKPITEDYPDKETVFLFIKKTVWKTRVVGYDDSEGKKWDENKKCIVDKYNNDKKALSDDYFYKKNIADVGIVKAKNRISSDTNEVQRMKNRLKSKEKELAEENKSNKRKALDKQQDLLDEATMDVIKCAFDSLVNNIRHNSDAFSEMLKQEIKLYTDKAADNFRAELEKCKNEDIAGESGKYAELSLEFEKIIMDCTKGGQYELPEV